MQDAVLLLSSGLFPIGLVFDSAESGCGFSGGNISWISSNFRGSRWQSICSIRKHASGIFEFQCLAVCDHVSEFLSLSLMKYKKIFS